MKKQTAFLLVMAIAILSCSNQSENIEGIYVRIIDHEFAIGTDTLFVKLANDKTYLVEKRSRFRRILKKKLQPSESHSQKWVGKYDDRDHFIRVEQSGKTIAFSEDKKTLLLGASEYQRVDN